MRYAYRALSLMIAADLGTSAAAFASEGPACQLVDATDPTALTPAWRGAVDSVQREVGTAAGAGCHGIEIVLSSDHGGLRVTARARDGREASRWVTAPAGLSAVVFGLLTTAPGEALPTTDDPLDLPPRDTVPSMPEQPAPPPAFGLSFSTSTGVRAAFPTRVLVADFNVRADFLAHDWLVTFRVRAAPLVLAMHGTYDDDAYDEAAVGLGLGKQIRIGRSILAVTGEANVTYIWLENDNLDLSAERAQLRLAAVGRWSYPVSRLVRLNTTLDGEISPTGLVNGSTAKGLAPLPAFTVGVGLGAEVLL